MKPSKYSLLDNKPSQHNYPEHCYQQSARNFVPQSTEDVPYAALQEQPQMHYASREIQMRQMQSGCNQSAFHQQGMTPYQQSRVNNSNYASQIPMNRSQVGKSNNGGYGSSINQWKSALGQQSNVYRIPSQYQGSVIRVDQSSMSVMRKQPYVPPVSAECPHCDCKQHIPGSADQYYCGKCHELNDIVPKFGFFICGVCHQKVCYPFRTSDHIQCNLCYSVNIVPTEAPERPKGSKVKLDAVNDSQIILPKDLQEQGERDGEQGTTTLGQHSELG